MRERHGKKPMAPSSGTGDSFCDHCQIPDHTKCACWNLNPELLPEKFRKADANHTDKGKHIAFASNGGELHLWQLDDADSNLSLMSIASSSSIGLLPTPDIGDELFTFWVEVKHTIVTAIFDSESQKNLVSAALVEHLRLPTLPHPHSYQPSWLRLEKALDVDTQCLLCFIITKDFIDEVRCEVIPLEICDVIIDAPYLYLRRAVIATSSRCASC